MLFEIICQNLFGTDFQTEYRGEQEYTFVSLHAVPLDLFDKAIKKSLSRFSPMP